MSRINLLDCTLRDGGYVNDWHFGRDAIFNIGKKIVLAGIEYFEIGFVRECEYSKDYSLFDGNDSVRDMIAPKNPDTHYVGMIDMGRPIPLEKLGKRVPDGFDVFRVIFKKSKIEEAYNYIQELEKLGYDVFAQAVGTDNYTDSEFIALIEKFNRLPIKAFYIVDSFGLIKKKDFVRLAQIADHNLREDIMLGYHSHNNMQQAMGNASAFTEMHLHRDIILDACVFGMGRGAGNLNLELFAEYMNENFDKQYRIEPMLEKIHKKALILGTGGASKAIEYGLKTLGLETLFVSRTKRDGCITYDEVTPEIIKEYNVIVNCTPVGMYPKADSCPNLPYEAMDSHNILYDLIYNPDETLFIKKGAEHGATTKNGLEMLLLQAFASWDFWNGEEQL